jgi:hypothetical protein
MQYSFESTAIYRPSTFTLANAGQPVRLVGEMVSASYFRLLGVSAEVGAHSFQRRTPCPTGIRSLS